MTMFATLRAYYSAFERRRRFARTERMICTLPNEVLKDIGWPGAAEGIGDRDGWHEAGLRH